MVIWFLGISGSGKTTLANELKKYLDKKNIKNYLIDGDNVRQFFENDLGFTIEERIQNIKRILFAVKVLEDNEIIVIVANIFPFEFLRKFARKKFKNYYEIFLRRSLKNIKNKEDVYAGKNVVGIDIEFEEPENPDLILDTDKLSIKDCIIKIIKKIFNEK